MKGFQNKQAYGNLNETFRNHRGLYNAVYERTMSVCMYVYIYIYDY